MDKLIGGVVEAAKFVAKHAPAIWLLTVGVLLAPVGWLAPLGVGPLVAQYRSYIGAFFLITTAFLLTPPIGAAQAQIRQWLVERREAARGCEYLEHLTTQEKETLRAYVHERKRIAHFGPDDAVAADLTLRGILYLPTDLHILGHRWGYSLSDWAFDYLMAHPELVEAGPGSADKDAAYTF